MTANASFAATPSNGIDDPEAVTDTDWFDEHPRRRYRARAGWLVRRVAGVHLRVAAPAATGDVEETAAEAAWWAAAWPKLGGKARDKAKSGGRRRER